MFKTVMIIGILLVSVCLGQQDVKIYGSDGTYLGKMNGNKYDPESVNNPYGKYGSKYSSTSINNSYSKYGSEYSNQSAQNSYATDAPILVGTDGHETQYLGHLSNNQYNSSSTGNECGQYGSKYSNSSINNTYSKWGTTTK
jgi:hypothetical protein